MTVLEMPYWNDSVCKCIYQSHTGEPATTLTIVLDFLFSLVFVVIGLILHNIFRKKLKEEKRNTPHSRKGNVIEPIMRWYLILEIIYWPYYMLFMWIMSHEILPSAWFSNCIVMNFLMNPLRIGRSMIAYNSFFVALIRYFYIVHTQKANEFLFEKVGKWFQVASIAVPLCMESIRFFTEEDMLGLISTDRFRNCVAFNEGLNSTKDMILPSPRGVAFTKEFLPPQLVDGIYNIYLVIVTLVYSNVVEAYLYFKMFQTVERYA